MKLKPPAPIPIEEYDKLAGLWTAAGHLYKSKGRDSQEAIEKQVAEETLRIIGVKTEAGDLAGAVLVSNDGRTGWLHRLVVHPDYRREGVAKSLLEAAERTLEEQGIGITAALVYAENEASLALFESAGFYDWPGIHYLSKRKDKDY